MANLARGTQSQQNLIQAQEVTTQQSVGGSYNAADAWGYAYSVPTTATVNVSNAPQVRSLMATAGANERAIRSQTWANIDNATAQVRRKMTEKYKVEF
jgi:hypothetical protein